MRPEFLVPESLTLHDLGPTAREDVQNALSLVGVQLPAVVLDRWTRFELIVACDWAVRVHLVASDHPKSLLREKPRFVALAEVTSRTHLGARVRVTYNGGTIVEGIMLATRSDGAVTVQRANGKTVHCWPLAEFRVLPD